MVALNDRLDVSDSTGYTILRLLQTCTFITEHLECRVQKGKVGYTWKAEIRSRSNGLERERALFTQGPQQGGALKPWEYV